MKRWANILLICASLLVLCDPVAALAKEPIKIGVLAFKAKPETLDKWNVLAEHLTKHIPEERFVVEAYTLPELELAVASRQVDFVLTNPAHYIKLHEQSGLSAPLATLVNKESGHELSVLGGVIFTRADNSQVNTLKDIKGKTVAIVGRDALGGYQTQLFELYKAGISSDDISVVVTGMPHDNVVPKVLNGEVDVGFVRTSVLDDLALKGHLDIKKIKIINQQDLADFPLLVSTKLYPEWAFTSSPHANSRLVRKVVAELLNFEEHVVAEKGAPPNFGFTVPVDYTVLYDVLRELRIAPFDVVPKITKADIWERYTWQIIAILCSLALFVTLSVSLLISKRKLQQQYLLTQAQQALLQQSSAETDAVLEALPDLLFDIGLDGRYYAAHALHNNLLAAPEKDLLGKTVQEVLPPAAADIVMAGIQEAELEGVSKGKEFELVLLGQGTFWFELSIAKKTFVNMDEPSRFVVISRDVTARKLAEKEIAIAATAFENQIGMMVTDANNLILKVNRAFTEVTGYTAQETIGQHPNLLKSGQQSPEFYQAMWTQLHATGKWQGEIYNKRKNGEVYPESLAITAVKNEQGEVTNYVASIVDITLTKAAAEQIENLAFYDALTGLPNRRLLIDRLRKALSVSMRSGMCGALFFLDLDYFKNINDSFGHDIGDLLLKQVAERLTNCVREGDTVARLGGDEFVVMLEDLGNKKVEAAKQAEMVANKILSALNQPYHLNHHEHHNTPSIGIVMFTDREQSYDEVIKRADIALYQAKKAGRNTLRFFDPDMQEAINTRAALEAELRKALTKQQFQLYYQPQISSQGDTIGAEVLIRWVHPERGLVSPFHFIPLAEETGLIVPIGQWILDAACAQLSRWQKNASTKHLTLAVNVSAKQFRQADFVTQVKHSILHHSINPAHLKLELTESMLLEQLDATIATMNALKEVGIHFSLDDFGTGYSSLQYLKKLPLYQLKIDQSFVRDIEHDVSDQAIIRTIIAMADTLNLNVIAEGVETEGQRALLETSGCHTYQGYLFSKPVPIEEFEANLV